MADFVRKRNRKFVRTVLPYLALAGGGALALMFFQRARFEFSNRNRVQMEYGTEAKKCLDESGLTASSKQSLEEMYKKMTNEANDNWENIRGPRADEDNSQYLAAKERQRAEREKKRAAMRAQRELFQQKLRAQDAANRGESR